MGHHSGDFEGNPTGDVITFDIPGPGVHTITPQTDLPSLPSDLTLDASSQPGYAGTPRSSWPGTALLTYTGVQGIGLQVGYGDTIRGLDINRWGIGIDVFSAAECTLEGNFIGTDPTGTGALGNATGVLSSVTPSSGSNRSSSAGQRPRPATLDLGQPDRHSVPGRRHRDPGGGQLHRHRRDRQCGPWATS